MTTTVPIPIETYQAMYNRDSKPSATENRSIQVSAVSAISAISEPPEVSQKPNVSAFQAHTSGKMTKKQKMEYKYKQLSQAKHESPEETHDSPEQENQDSPEQESESSKEEEYPKPQLPKKIKHKELLKKMLQSTHPER